MEHLALLTWFTQKTFGSRKGPHLLYGFIFFIAPLALSLSLSLHIKLKRGSNRRWKHRGVDCHWLGIILFVLPSEKGLLQTNKRHLW